MFWITTAEGVMSSPPTTKLLVSDVVLCSKGVQTLIDLILDLVCVVG
jgi:hypothetical protein